MRLSTTEARAHLGGALDAFKLGATEDGASAITNYGYLLDKKKLGTPADATIAALTKELKAVYAGLDETQRTALQDALTTAGKNNWMGKISLG